MRHSKNRSHLAVFFWKGVPTGFAAPAWRATVPVRGLNIGCPDGGAFEESTKKQVNYSGCQKYIWINCHCEELGDEAIFWKPWETASLRSQWPLKYSLSQSEHIFDDYYNTDSLENRGHSAIRIQRAESGCQIKIKRHHRLFTMRWPLCLHDTRHHSA